jgi:hypothetical protein
VAAHAVHLYFLHQAFPDLVKEDDVLKGFDYVLGRHPASNVSYVSTVGTSSKLIAYGNNRADYTFIPGGMIPGVVIIQPDFPELKSDWPFLRCSDAPRPLIAPPSLPRMPVLRHLGGRRASLQERSVWPHVCIR